MKSYLPTATLISLALLATACGPAAEQPVAEAPSQAEDVAAIKSGVEQYVAVVGDASASVALFTDDGVLMPPNEPAVIGKEAMLSYNQAFWGQFTEELTLSPEEVEVAGDWAFARGTAAVTYTPKAGGQPTEDTGKWLQIWRRGADGSWKLAHDIWNSDQPLPGAGE